MHVLYNFHIHLPRLVKIDIGIADIVIVNSLLGIVNILKLVRDCKKIVKMVYKDSPYTQGFLIAITFQIDAIIG